MRSADAFLLARTTVRTSLLAREPKLRCYVDTRYLFFPPALIEDCQFLPQLAPGWPERLRRVNSYGTDYYLLKTAGPHGVLWQAIRCHASASRCTAMIR